MSYQTLARDAEAEIEVKRSRFLARVARVEDEDAARAVIEQARHRHWGARHRCSAFVLGPDGRLQRSNDDAEPAGTAGAPMLDVLVGRGLSDVVAVVTRWFGGTLLGAGGLVRAYGDAVRAALDRAGTLRRDLLGEYRLRLGHEAAGRVESELRARGVPVLEVSYGAEVELLLGSPDRQALTALVGELTAGGAEPELVGQRWVDGVT